MTITKQQPFWLMNETRVGHIGDHAEFDLDQPMAPIDRSLELALCNSFRIWHWPPTRELMDEIVDKAGFVMVDFWIGTKLQNHWIEAFGKSAEEFYDYHIEMLKEAADKYGDKFFWTITGEPDSQAPNWPVEQFNSKQDAREFFVNWIKDIAPAMDPDTKLRWYSYLESRQVDLSEHNVAIHLGYPMSAHHAYELGVRMVWNECNCFLVEGAQVVAAFVRGASNQFRKNNTYWGLDFSPWNDLTHMATNYDENGQRRGGATDCLLLREWMYAFLAGANLLLEEVSDRTHWVWNPQPYAKLSKVGEKAARFGKFAMSHDRGTPYRSVGVMLEHDHGWLSALDDSGGNQVWFGTIPVENADLSIGHFFDLAFPGHADGLKGYAELYAEQPWNTQGEFKAMVESGKDMRPYEKGRLATSRWGDVIDVVLDNCPEDVLADYKILVVLGDLTITEALAKKLERYAQAGGTVITNVTNFFDCPAEQLENHVSHGTQGRSWSIPSLREGTVSPEIEQLVGFKFTGIKLKASSSYCSQCGTALSEDGFLHEQIELGDAEVIASVPRYLYPPEYEYDRSYNQDPLAVERKIGKGKIIVTLAYHMMHPTFRTPLKITEHIYDHVIRETLPIQIDGPAVQYLYNRIDDGWLVSIFNNSDKLWQGELVSTDKPTSTSIEWGDEGAHTLWQSRNNGWNFAVEVPVFDFKIIKVITQS